MHEREKEALQYLKSCKAVRFVDYNVAHDILVLEGISETGIRGEYKIISPSEELREELKTLLFGGKEEMKTDESKHIIELVIKDKLKKEAEELIQRFEIANSMNCYMSLTPDRKQIGEMLVMIAEPREKRIAELEKENAELKCGCSRCIYTNSPCVLSDYEKDENGTCSHFKSIFDENAELKEQLIKATKLIRSLYNYCCSYGATGKATTEAEQFLKGDNMNELDKQYEAEELRDRQKHDDKVKELQEEAEEYAEEYAGKARIKDKNTYTSFPDECISSLQDYEGNYMDISERIIKAFKDGAEFGYNKANEWHYVKDGDLPKEDMTVAVLVSLDIGNRLIIGNVENTYVESFRREFNPLEDLRVCHNAISCEVVYLHNVIAWKEIVLPELKESK